MATLIQALPIVPQQTSHPHFEFIDLWKNRIAYWQQEAGFLMDIVDLHCDVKKLALHARKSRYQFELLIKEELPGLVRSLEKLSCQSPTANKNTKKRLTNKLMHAEEKFNLLKLLLLEVAANSIPLRLT